VLALEVTTFQTKNLHSNPHVNYFQKRNPFQLTKVAKLEILAACYATLRVFTDFFPKNKFQKKSPKKISWKKFKKNILKSKNFYA
jgi:hypothetical protein